MSLYLKYRPQDFSSVVGQSHVVQTLENTLKQNNLAHAYLFCGPRGTGKTSMARIVAKSLNCTNRQPESAEPCHTCEICMNINQGRLVDLIEIDAASNRGIDEIRDLRDKIVFTPTQAKAKVYIIDEVHMLTKEAFNALLKTLEEPPDHAYFILATTEAHKIPETIISRCQQFTFKRIENQDIVNRLSFICKQEGFECEENALSLIAKAAHGGLRDAIGMLEQMAASGAIDYESASDQLGVSGNVVMEKFAQALLDQNPLAAIELLDQIHNQGKALSAFLEEWVSHLRDQMLSHLDFPKEIHQYIQWIDLFTAAKQQLSQAIIPQLPIEVAIIRACNFEVKNEKLLEKVEKVTLKEVDAPSPATKVHGSEAAGKPPVSATESMETKEIHAVSPNPKVQEEDRAQEETSQEQKEIEKSSTTSFTFDLPTIQKKWGELLEAVEIPFVKMSLMDGQPVKVEENTLYLEFNSSTLMEKVESGANQGMVLKAFEEIFNTKPILHFSVKKITLSPIIPKMEQGTAGKKEDSSVIEMAQEVFGIEN